MSLTGKLANWTIYPFMTGRGKPKRWLRLVGPRPLAALSAEGCHDGLTHSGANYYEGNVTLNMVVLALS
jgi:hypothetical protein